VVTVEFPVGNLEVLNMPVVVEVDVVVEFVEFGVLDVAYVEALKMPVVVVVDEVVEFDVGNLEALKLPMVAVVDGVVEFVEFDILNVVEVGRDVTVVAEVDVVKLLTGVEKLEFAPLDVEVVWKSRNLEWPGP
jgi:hypothetical protein